jgi:hypothetical protein
MTITANPKWIKTTKYYDEFIRYYQMAKTQQEECNLGIIAHENSSVPDDLMKHVHLYDVVERKYAGFSQIVNDVFYGWSEDHPYWHKMEQGLMTKQRDVISHNWTGKRSKFNLSDWLYLFLFHRLTGSGINYSMKPSGYHNTLLPDMHVADNVPQLIEVIKSAKRPFYTSVGYQFPSFPKPVGNYKRGGDYFLCEFAPQLAKDVARFLENGEKKNLREIGDFMFKWNADRGLRAYRFQYAAFIADVADWFPEFVNKESPFYYGKNAKECISYLATKSNRMDEITFLDSVMMKIYEDTGSYPYNAEDVACDAIRWIENYCKVGSDYDHLDLDHVWNSSNIKDHPYGRQKAMLELKLVPTFNNLTNHPSDDKIIKSLLITPEQYKEKVGQLYNQKQNHVNHTVLQTTPTIKVQEIVPEHV